VRYIANPLNAFSMIKRATVDLALVIARLSERNQPVATLARYSTKESSLTHAVKCLLLIQRLYKLSTDDIARGLINYRRIGDKMTPNDLFVIGNIAANIAGEQFLAHEYLESALRNIQNDKFKELDAAKLLLTITRLCERMHDYKSAARYLKDLLMREPDNAEAAEYAMRIVAQFQTHGTSKLLPLDDPFNVKLVRDGRYSKRKEFELVSDVCRGALTSDSKMLQCRYTSSSTPFARFKVEEVSRTPHIALFVDVLSDNEIQSLKRITQGAGEKSNYDAALYDKDHELVARISRRIEVSREI
jgi:tetratricopeptide (TPR) repeat protein